MTYGLTRRMQRCLDFIRAYQIEHGYSPTYTEIAVGNGLSPKSKANVNRLMVALQERGHIARLPGRGRSIALLPNKAEAA